MNYLLASHVWRQDHNGFTHQDPGFIDVVMNKKPSVVRVYLPPDANCLLSVIDHCLRSRQYVNVVIAGKHPAPQWLTMDAAVKHCSEGIGIWQWASNDQGVAPDVVMACCGDVPTLETLAAVSIMRTHLPDLKIRVVNVVDLMKLQPQTEHPHGLSDIDFDELFTKDKPVIFAFHAYPWLIHRLTYRRTNHDNIHVRGYKEEGTITTPFDMTVLNDLDRFHLVMDAIDRLPQTGDKGVYLKQQLKDKLIEHKQYIDKHGEDMPEIRNWQLGRGQRGQAGVDRAGVRGDAHDANNPKYAKQVLVSTTRCGCSTRAGSSRRHDMTTTTHWKGLLLTGLLWAALPGLLRAQMNMNPYFTAINYPLESHSLMLMALQDYQSARYGNDFVTGMLMALYGLTPQESKGYPV